MVRPSLSVARPSGPTSPPETPTKTSPVFGRKPAINVQLSPPSKTSQARGHRTAGQGLDRKGLGYGRGPRPEEISPQSSLSSSEEEEESDSSASPPDSPVSDIPVLREPVAQVTAASLRIVEATFAIEEMSDYDPDDSDDDDNRLNVLRPYGFEYPESDRSRSRSRPPPEVDPVMMRRFADLDCFDDSDSDEDQDDEFVRQLRRKREERRLRRMKSGSISKRTVSERGSESDKEDVLLPYDGPESGLNTRRVRRKTDRHSLQFSGQFPERIEELKEPNSEDEIILNDAEIFARELPYWTLMDVDSENDEL
jgi:hypothetical protein